jgi:hypothetical protein
VAGERAEERGLERRVALLVEEVGVLPAKEEHVVAVAVLELRDLPRQLQKRLHAAAGVFADLRVGGGPGLGTDK